MKDILKGFCMIWGSIFIVFIIYNILKILTLISCGSVLIGITVLTFTIFLGIIGFFLMGMCIYGLGLILCGICEVLKLECDIEV